MKQAPKKTEDKTKKQAAKPVSVVSKPIRKKVIAPQPEAPAITPLTPVQQLNARRILLQQELKKKEEKFAELLPKHIPATKFISVFMNACISNTSLLQCTPTSLLTCAVRSAQLGLLPDTDTKEAHLIPFVNYERHNQLEAQFLPGYRGLIQLALRTGQVKKFQARAVHEGDEFYYEYGTAEFIKHVPKKRSLNITDVYAIVESVNGGMMFDVMSRDEVEAVRNDSPEWKRTPEKKKGQTFWALRFPDMAMKTVIRRISRYAPISSEFQFAVSLDEKIEVIGKSQIDTENINWDELSTEEQERYLEELLKKDEEKKDILLSNVLQEKQEIKKTRVKNLMEETENLVTKP